MYADAGDDFGSAAGVNKMFLALVVAIAVPLAPEHSRTGLFSTYDTLELRLEAPFEGLFTRAKDQPDFSVDGTLTIGGHHAETPVPVTVALRGHTSRREGECTFPKLKVSVVDGPADVVSLLGGRTLKIGTHCGEATEDTLTAKFGRLPNERSPWREASVYRILDALDVPALLARPARITYVYTAPSEANGAALPDSITRNAVIIEDEDDAVRRLGGNGQIEPARFTTADDTFTAEDTATLAFAEALIGNFDWCVKFTASDTYRCDARQKLWNVLAARTGDGKARPMMYDFDVSGMVTGSHRWFRDVFNGDYDRTRSARQIEVIAQVQRTRSLFGRDLLDMTRRRFIDRRDAAYRELEAAPLDDTGRRHIRDYMDGFFSEISDTFYRPVVIQPSTMLRDQPSGAPVCTSPGPAPVGTPISRPIETRDNMVRVVVLDALWHWTAPAHCPIVQTGTPWIEANAIGTDYPIR
jgi:hypothetical protein